MRKGFPFFIEFDLRSNSRYNTCTMPELPEVEIVRTGLAALLPGKKIVAVWHDWPKGFPNSAEDVKTFLVGATVLEVKRRAKVLLIELDTKYSLVIHLKMTGQLVYVRSQDKHLKASELASEETERFGAGHPSNSLIDELPDKSTRVIFDLENVRGSTSHIERARLFFNDQRKFGWVRLLPTLEVPNIDFFKKIGPEPLADDFSFQDFAVRLRKRLKSKIKAVLIDQTIVAGVGNIYADESLYAAKIHPATLVKDIPVAKLRNLYGELRAIMNLSIEKGGSSDRNYVNAEGKKGSYLNFAQVFRKQGLACPRCGAIIQKIRVAGRGTHICSNCQVA